MCAKQKDETKTKTTIIRQQDADELKEALREMSCAIETIKYTEPLGGQGFVDLAEKLKGLHGAVKARLDECVVLGDWQPGSALHRTGQVFEAIWEFIQGCVKRELKRFRTSCISFDGFSDGEVRFDTEKRERRWNGLLWLRCDRGERTWFYESDFETMMGALAAIPSGAGFGDVTRALYKFKVKKKGSGIARSECWWSIRGKLEDGTSVYLLAHDGKFHRVDCPPFTWRDCWFTTDPDVAQQRLRCELKSFVDGTVSELSIVEWTDCPRPAKA
jgi:hypothetical protein